MSNIQERLDEAVATAEATSDKFYNIVHGADDEVIAVDSGNVPTVAKTIKDIRDSISTGVNDLVTTATEAKEIVVAAKNDIFSDAGFIAVSQDLLNENTIGTVAYDINDVKTTASISAAISNVSAIKTNVSTLAANIASINTNTTNIANINMVSDSIANVNSVADNEANINIASQNKNNINIVAVNNGNITEVASVSTAVSDVANIKTNVSTVANANDNIALIVANIEDVQNAAQNAISASNSASSALTSKQEAAQSAEQAAASANLSDASTTIKGVIQLATSSEATTGANSSKAIVPSTLKSVISANNTNIANIYATKTNLNATQTSANNHIGNKANPHVVTKSQVGLGSCDNTSDISKPISTATQSALNTKQLINLPVKTLATSGTIALSDNSINRITPTSTVTFSLPSVTNHTYFHQILVQMTLSATRTINLGTSVYFGGEAPEFETGKYNIIYEHNGSAWVVGAVLIG